MKIYAISDLHLDYEKEKPMDIFGECWKNHEEKIFDNWQKKITEDDIVLMPGDISWAINLDKAV
ncbi:MAG TPA: serine/threonine protein phosphatase, partial [Clostridiales bacterium]|nr:serine/threonine protein phosphatase [Clostridiales bacterium]